MYTSTTNKKWHTTHYILSGKPNTKSSSGVQAKCILFEAHGYRTRRPTDPGVRLGHDDLREIRFRKIRFGCDHAAQVEPRGRLATCFSATKRKTCVEVGGEVAVTTMRVARENSLHQEKQIMVERNTILQTLSDDHNH